MNVKQAEYEVISINIELYNEIIEYRYFSLYQCWSAAARSFSTVEFIDWIFNHDDLVIQEVKWEIENFIMWTTVNPHDNPHDAYLAYADWMGWISAYYEEDSYNTDSDNEED